MAHYEGYYHRSIETVFDLDKLGEVKLEDMGNLPFFGVNYRGK